VIATGAKVGQNVGSDLGFMVGTYVGLLLVLATHFSGGLLHNNMFIQKYETKSPIPAIILVLFFSFHISHE
jgi:hypothetical protein